MNRSEIDIILCLSKWIDPKRFPIQIPRAFFFGWECDYFTVDSHGVAREYEIKISRSDFVIDQKKAKHSDQTKGANYFYYVCPENLLAPVEIPNRYGLIYVSDNGELMIVKNPKKLHSKPFEQWKELSLKLYWKWFTLWGEKHSRKEITTSEYRSGMTLDEIEKCESSTDETPVNIEKF